MAIVPNALPLTRAQLSALLRGVVWQFGWGLRISSHERRSWRARAAAIPDATLREDALHAIDCKRGHVDGAALFWTLADRRHPTLLRLLVTFELIYDYFDDISERGAHIGVENSHRMALALRDALTPGKPHADYYRFHPWSDDGGYLRALVDACRSACSALPSFDVVRPLIDRELARVTVLGLNHELDAADRDAALAAWTAEEFPGEDVLAWYEQAAASSQSTVTLMLLALAANPSTTAAEAQAAYDAYFPWFAYGVTMLDSYADQLDDAASGAHSYISHYPNHDAAVARLREGVERAADRLLALPHGERHAVLLGCMVAMYLSKDSARGDGLRSCSTQIRDGGGTLTAILMPILRTWRVCNAQTSAT